MRNSSRVTSLYSINGGDRELIVGAVAGERPALVYWGPKLRHSKAAQLPLLTGRSWAHGGPSVDLCPSLSMELGSGVAGSPGLLMHRDGRGWTPDLRTSTVDQRGEHELTVHCQCTGSGVAAEYNFALDSNTGVLCSQATITNKAEPGLSLDWCTALTVPIDDRLTVVRGFWGRWAGEFGIEDVPLHQGIYLRENRSGRTSHHTPPFVIIKEPHTNENTGLCAAFHLGWSGNHRTRVEQTHDHRAFIQMGEYFFPGEICLKKGDSYTTPPLFAVWSEHGFNGASQRLHQHLADVIINDRSRHLPRPVHYNTWEAVYFNHSEEKLMALAEAASTVGVERFVLDDGWFGERRDDAAGLGDWIVAKDPYPNGLGRLREHVRDLGMQFGLWFEPEMVNPVSDLYTKHPDWVLSAPDHDDIPSRNQLVLDLTNQEVTEYLFDSIDSIIGEYDVDYIKWDMNRDIDHPGDKDGFAVPHEQTAAFYRLIAKLRLAHPHVEIESCASGGARADYGVMAYTDRIWVSDNNDASDRQYIQRGGSYLFPLRVSGSHVGPKTCHITGRKLDMSFRVATALFGHMGVEADLFQETDEDLAILAEGIDLYKEYRDLLHSGDLYRLDGPDAFICTSVVAKDKSQAIVSAAKITGHAMSQPGRLRLAGLDHSRNYLMKIVWPLSSPALTKPSLIEHGDLYGAGIVVSGEALCRVGFQLPLIHPLTNILYTFKTGEGCE